MAASKCAQRPRKFHRQRPCSERRIGLRGTGLRPRTVFALRAEQRLGSVVGEAQSIFRRGSSGPVIAFRFVGRIVLERSVAQKSRAQTDLKSNPWLAAPALFPHVYFERRLSRRTRGVRLLRRHGLVRISNPRENARPPDQSVGAARWQNQLCERA